MEKQDAEYVEAVRALNKLKWKNKLSVEEQLQGLEVVITRKHLDKLKITDEDIAKMKIIYITGTKGKGSTSAFVESILRHNGISVGFFCSPHLLEVRERFRINGKPISHQVFTKYFWEVAERLDITCEVVSDRPYYFRFLLVLGFYIFKHEPVEATIIEVGIGGECDYTNVIKQPAICGVSSLGIDHQDILGNTLESIAWHKGGIFKNNAPAFTVEQPPEAMTVLQQRANDVGTSLQVVSSFDNYFSKSRSEIKLGLPGAHQKLNASLAVQLANCWLNQRSTIPPTLQLSLDEHFIEGLASCQWYGRCQIIKFDSITFYLDGAHTMKSLSCAAKWFNKESAEEQSKINKDCKKILAFYVSDDRDSYNLLSPLLGCEFSCSLFTPNTATLLPSSFSDLDYLKYSHEERMQKVSTIRGNWLNRWKDQNPPQPAPNPFVFETVADAVCWLTKDREPELYKKSLEMTRSCPEVSARPSAKHLQVLVTGSLYLVGGYLRVVKPDLYD